METNLSELESTSGTNAQTQSFGAVTNQQPCESDREPQDKGLFIGKPAMAWAVEAAYSSSTTSLG